MAYSTGLPAYVLIKVLAPGFFAREDTKTPVQIAGAAIGINIALNLILMQSLGYVGLALAASISAWLNAAALAIVLRRRGQFRIDTRLRNRGPRICFATAGMAIGIMIGERGLRAYCEAPCDGQVFVVALLIFGGLFLYGGFAQLLRATQWQEFNWPSDRKN